MEKTDTKNPIFTQKFKLTCDNMSYGIPFPSK